MVNQVNSETGEVELVTPMFTFEQADAESFASMFVWTPEFLEESDGDTDDDIAPYQFTDTFKLFGDEGYLLLSTDQFLFYDECYGTWLVAELKDGEYDKEGEVNESALLAALAASGFTENKAGPHQ